MVDPAGSWRRNAGQYWERILASFPQGSCGDRDPVDCFSAEQFIKHVFMDSDTQLAVLSFVPELPESNPLSLEEAERAADRVGLPDGDGCRHGGDGSLHVGRQLEPKQIVGAARLGFVPGADALVAQTQVAAIEPHPRFSQPRLTFLHRPFPLRGGHRVAAAKITLDEPGLPVRFGRLPDREDPQRHRVPGPVRMHPHRQRNRVGAHGESSHGVNGLFPRRLLPAEEGVHG